MLRFYVFHSICLIYTAVLYTPTAFKYCFLGFFKKTRLICLHEYASLYYCFILQIKRLFLYVHLPKPHLKPTKNSCLLYCSSSSSSSSSCLLVVLYLTCMWCSRSCCCFRHYACVLASKPHDFKV